MGASAVYFADMIIPEILDAMACSEAFSLAADIACQRLVISTDC